MNELNYCVVSDSGIDCVCKNLDDAKRVAQTLSVYGRTEVHQISSVVAIDEGDCIIVTDKPLFVYEKM